MVSRLSEVTGVRALAASALDDVEKIKAPAYVVVFDGLDVKDASGARDAVMAESSWLVVGIARNATRAAASEAARHGALEMGEAAVAALAGWLPDGAARPLKFAGADGLEIEPPVALLPLRFRCELHLL